MSGASDFLNSRSALATPWIDSPFFEPLLEQATEDEELRGLARKYREDGFLILENVFTPEQVDAVVDSYDELFDPGRSFPTRPGKPSILTHDPNRRQDAWTVCEPVRDIACHPRVLEILKFLYGRAPIPFQTLNFLPGTGQEVHTDSIHFDSLPAGYMCGVWVALEDITEDNGPLLYYPGSHRLPRIGLDDFGVWAPPGDRAASPQYDRYAEYLEAVIEAYGFEQKRLTVPKGTGLVWASNLLHGGAPVRDPSSTRRSQVTHYYFEDCVYFAPILSNEAMGEYRLKQIFDIVSDEYVPQRLHGEEVDSLVMGKEGRRRLVRAGLNPWDWMRQVARRQVGRRVQRFAERRGWERLENRARRFADKVR